MNDKSFVTGVYRKAISFLLDTVTHCVSLNAGDNKSFITSVYLKVESFLLCLSLLDAFVVIAY